LIRVFLFWQSAMKNDDPDFGRVAQSLSHMDWKIILLAVGLSFVAGILSGIYPAWRVGRLAPATFLKVQ
jgi:ABC-type lipoprotein release transport system permease subunit